MNKIWQTQLFEQFNFALQLSILNSLLDYLNRDSYLEECRLAEILDGLFFDSVLQLYPIRIPESPPCSTISFRVSKFPDLAALWAGVSKKSFLTDGLAPWFNRISALALKWYLLNNLAPKNRVLCKFKISKHRSKDRRGGGARF